MKGVNFFLKVVDDLKKGHQKFLRIVGCFSNFFSLKIYFPKLFVTQIFASQYL